MSITKRAALVVVAVALSLPVAALAQGTVGSSAAGPFHVVLKLLPAESFTGADAAMVRDGGAKPMTLASKAHPNYHLVAFVTKDGKPVTKATVKIRYRRIIPLQEPWHELPIVKMHVAGKMLTTTHFGNNLRLMPGWFETTVTVDGHRSKVLRFHVRAGSPSVG